MNERASQLTSIAFGAEEQISPAPWTLRLRRFFVSLGVSLRSPATSRHLRIVERLSVGSKGSVILVNCSGVNYLAGLGTEGVTSLLCVSDSGHPSSSPASGEQR